MARRLKTLTDMRTMLGALSRERLLRDLPESLAGRLDAPRYRARLERRILHRSGAAGAVAELLDGPAPALVALEEEGLRRLVADVGAMCQYAALRRVIDRTVLDALSARLDLPLAGHDARIGRQGDSLDRAVEIAAPPPDTDDPDAVAHAILREGLQCWACWIDGHPPEQAGFYRILTPSFPGRDGEVSATGCRPRDCRPRVALFDARLALAVAGDDIVEEGKD